MKDAIIGGEGLVLPPEIAEIVKLAGKKHRQHYVFQHYLKAWAIDGKVWVRRRGSEKAFHTSTLNIAAERHFYKLQPVKEEDLALIRRVFLDSAPDYVKERCETIIHNMTMPLAIKSDIDPSNSALEEVSAWLDEHIINAQEDGHCIMEESLVANLNDMLNGKTGFYYDNDSAQEFFHAIFFQYMRTKKMRDAAEAMRVPVPGADMKRCAGLYTLIATMVFADAMYRRRDQYKIVLLDNLTEIPFITGDQPIFNIHTARRTGVATERLELFYPLSPKRAMALVEVPTERKSNLNQDEVDQFNEMVLWNSHEQVFSNSRDLLEGFEMD